MIDLAKIKMLSAYAIIFIQDKTGYTPRKDVTDINTKRSGAITDP
jgi:hypothetical protein